MAFKSLAQYQADKNGDFFVLNNDGEFADVIFLYRDVNDVLVADVHYINTMTYKGYVHCCEQGCPACNYGERGLRLDHKIFIPLYNIRKNKIEFWDRSTYFEQVLQKDVFTPFPNPSEAVFRITRKGEFGSRDTKYKIEPVGRNSAFPYDKILSDFHITLPEGFSAICKEMSAYEMDSALNSRPTSSDLADYGYTPIPRAGASTPAPEVSVPVTQYSAPPEVAPPVMSEYVPDVNSAAEAPQNEELHYDVDAALNSAPSDDSADSLDDVHF